MTQISFPRIPTTLELQNSEGDVYYNIKMLEKLRVHVQRPSKPIQPKDTSSAGYREYADKLEQYEKELEEFEIQQKECGIHNTKVETLIKNYICEESGLNNIPDQYRNKVFSKARSDGHGEGHYAVYNQLCELVEIFN